MFKIEEKETYGESQQTPTNKTTSKKRKRKKNIK